MKANVGQDTQADVQGGLDLVVERLVALAGAEGQPSPAKTVGLDDPTLANPQLQALIRAFGLTAFEAQLLLLAFGAEVSPEIAALCADCHEDEDAGHASFRLGVALFPGADWTAFSPSGALRRWDLINLEPGPTLLDSPIRISEFALHWLCGAPSRDRLLMDVLGPVPAERSARLTASQQAFARRLAALAGQDRAVAGGQPLVLICPDLADADAVVGHMAAILRVGVDRLYLDAVAPADRPALERAIRREHALSPGLTTVAFNPREPDDRVAAAMALLQRLPGPLMVTFSERPNHAWGPIETFPNPTREEQLALWRARLGKAGAGLEAMLGRFDLGFGAIDTAYAAATLARDEAPGKPPTWRAAVSQACRQQLRGPLEAFADRIDSRANLDDLVLPPAQRAQLEAIISDVANQSRVLTAWQAGGGSSRGLGLTALFSGPSGSGKTTAAEALAAALDLDLYRIDLSAVVSKYIGETEKQLAKVFDAAERGANLLLFDEGDALFGKRTEVRDSHDRYANQEISFLLQKLESYRGLAVLASNLADSMDAAFMRRFRYVIEFPQPGPAQREAIWRRVFGGEIVTEGLDPARLARLNLSGGAIRNVALRAAFLAAAEGGPVTMARVYQAAEEEYRKLHKVMTDDERGED